MRYILGPIAIALGVLLMKYTVQVTNITGQVGFAEKYLKGGLAGTYTWYRLVGLAIIIVSFLWMVGFLQVWFG
jgi:hypothetical protein